MNDKPDKELDELRIRSLCAGLEAEWEPPEYSHWISLHKAANELRSTVSQAFVSMQAVDGDNDLMPAAKRRKKQEIATETIAQLDQLTSYQKATQSVARQMQRWADKLVPIIKPAQTEAEALLHGEIRRHVASLDERHRMSFLEKHGDDPRVASAVLEAPPFLSGTGDADVALVKSKIEQKHLSAEIVAAKAKVEKALTELERGRRTAKAMIAQRAGLERGIDGAWNTAA